MLDYDTSGQARTFEMAAFESDFAEWQTQDFMKFMFGSRSDEYAEYDKLFPGGGRSSGRREVPEAYKPMLKDIVDAIERRHSGTLQWFRSHCYHTDQANVLSVNEFVKAIDALGILAQGHWRFSVQDLYAILKIPGQDDVDLHELDYMCKGVQKGEMR
jgi:hypothetical protein